MPIVTLTTDFGPGSHYVAAMKGVLLSIQPAVTIVDICHAVPPQDIAAGARMLARTVPWFPAGTVHVAVVDPGVGTDRALVCLRWREAWLVGPDNGIFSPLLAIDRLSEVVRITNPRYWQPLVSPTFHGRDIMAPVAAHLTLGIPASELGPPHAQLVELALPQVVAVNRQLKGEVVEVDSFGNLITNITAAQLAEVPHDSGTRIVCDEHETFGIQQTYADQPPMTLVALVGSGGQLEIAIVDDSAAMMLGVRTGAEVTVQW